jgi:predicted deacetylase
VSAPRQLVVSVHDVAPPQWNQVRRMLDVLTAIGVRHRSLLVIPDYHGHSPIDRHEDFCEWLRQRQHEGDEIVLHGYEHIERCAPHNVRDRFKNRWFTQGEGEFLSLDYARARERIERGMAMFARTGLDAQGFVAPAWLINRAGVKAARDCGFQYTNSYLRFSDLRDGWSRLAPSLVFGPGHLNEDVGIHVQERACRALAHSPIVRVVLHPPCVEHPARLERIVAIITRRLRSHDPVSYLQLLARLREPRLRSAS